MRNFLFIICILIISISCSEQKNSQIEGLTEIQSEPVIMKRFFPENVETIIEDTIVNDSIRLIIKLESSDIDFVSNSYELNSDTTFLDLYRDNNVSVSLNINDSIVYANGFGKKIFNETMPLEFMEESIIILVWYDSFETEQNEVKMRMTICVPETDYCYLYSLYVSASGIFRYEMEEVY
jgi:hypothetical protein